MGWIMPRKNPYICPKCGTKAEKPVKTWQLIAPIPDARGRITITVMGSFQCLNCGYKWRGVVSKIKAGAEGVEIESVKGKKALGGQEKEEKRRGTIIEIDLNEKEG